MQDGMAQRRPLRVLVAWELGANLGHLLRLEPIAQALRDRGHAVSWAVPDPAAAGAQLGGGPWELLRIPRPVSGEQAQPACYADILAAHGFGDDAVLSSAMQTWRRLLDLVKPEVMLVDHAPLALLAGRLHGVPTAHVATGWESPPFDASLPVLRPRLAASKPGGVHGLERELVARINRLCEAHRAPPLASLGELYRAQATLLATWPETDHFQPRPDRPWFAPDDPRREPLYVGPLFSTGSGETPSWPSGAGPRVFVYMQRGAAAQAVLKALERMEVRVVAAIPGLSGAERAAASSGRCHVHGGPVQLGALLDSTDVVVSHGGHGLVAASLLAGVPLVTVPAQLEQAMLAAHIAAMGAAEHVAAKDLGERFTDAVLRVATEPAYRLAAESLAAKYRGFDPLAVAQRIAATVEDMGWRLSRQAVST